MFLAAPTILSLLVFILSAHLQKIEMIKMIEMNEMNEMNEMTG